MRSGIYRYRHTYINENLTAYRRKIFREVRKEKLWHNWTYDGKIFVSEKSLGPQNRVIKKITCKADYEKVLNKKFVD